MNMLATIVPKSDQLNSDDLIGRTLTIKVKKVSLLAGEQPVAISFENDGGKPYKPCKSMRRVLVNVWGSDGGAYAGRSMTLYRDEAVAFGGAAVGGIRISHMTGIEGPVTMALTASKANRRPFTVKPLVVPNDAPAPDDAAAENKVRAKADALIARVHACETESALQAMQGDPAVKKGRTWMDDNRPELAAAITDAFAGRYGEIRAEAALEAPMTDAGLPGDEYFPDNAETAP